MLFGWNRVGPRPAFLRHLHGGGRHADLGLLDPRGQQLDADAAGLRDRRRPRSCRSTGGGDLQSRPSRTAWSHMVLAAYPHHRPRRRRASAPGICCAAAHEPARAHACSRWRCGWCCSWRRSSRWSATPHGLNTLEHQPAKIAAHRRPLGEPGDGRAADAVRPARHGRPSETRFAVEIPHLGSLILTHTWNGEIKGLKDFRATTGRTPPIVFWTFRVMVGLGLADDRRSASSALVLRAARPALRGAAGSCALPWPWGRPASSRARRLDHHRGRPPALGGLRRAAHRRRRLAGAGAAGIAASLLPSSLVYLRSSSASASSTCCG